MSPKSMDQERLKKEVEDLKRDKEIHDALNDLFEMFINMARSSTEEQVLNSTMQRALDIAAHMSKAELGSIFLLNTRGVVTDSILTRNQIQGEKRSSLIGKVLDTGLAGWVKDNLKVGLITDTQTDPRWMTFKNQSYVVSSALAVPILRHDTLFGIMTLMHSKPNHFDDACVKIIQKTANQMAIAIENAQLYKKLEQAGQAIEKYSKALQFELDQGRKIQKDFLPCHLPDIDGWDICSYFTPALKLSGDFYDLFELPDDHIGFVVGDVSGKGVGSALFMALSRSLLRVFSGVFAANENSPDAAEEAFKPEHALKAVSMVNDYMAKEHCDDGMFVTLFFGVIHTKTGQVRYSSAGHEAVLMVNQAGVKKQLEATGPALGPLEGADYEVKMVQMGKGDILVGYTDGVTEARSASKEFYTRDRLIDVINTSGDNPLASADKFVETIKTDLFEFTGDAPQSDDVTILAVRWAD